MNGEALARASLEHFDRLMDADAPTRTRELERLALEHPELGQRVASLLAAAEQARSADFLTAPKAFGEFEVPASEHHPGDLLGVYRLDAPLGRGGMGEVWRAYRTDGAYDAPVAIKLLQGHLVTGSARERFLREGRILGSLSHPHIARLLDAGVTPAGQQFLVLEYVDGRPVDRWCDEHGLDVRARIELFLQICAAVAYAHSRLIVHRDLKAGNILVAGDGRVKLLDFGIAKLLEAESADAEATELTRIGGSALTPQYAAPEQLLGEPVTTATDVYALGVLLYRLLTGRHPYATGGRSPVQLTFDVLKAHPRAASDVARRDTTVEVSAAQIAALRATTPRALSQSLRGDLDAIVAKALRKEPDARYADARALAGDLEHHLRHEPVSARTGARAYVWSRFLRRNWLPLSVGLAFVLTVLAGSAVVWWQSRQTAREAHRAAAVTNFLVSMFSSIDPRIAQGAPRSDITARELLDNSARRIAGEFASDPDVEIRLLGITADIYRALGDHPQYKILHQEQMRLVRARYGELSADYINGVLTDALEAESLNDSPTALAVLDQAAVLIRRAHREDSVLQARWLLLRGDALTADTHRQDERGKLLEQSVQLYQRLAPTSPDYIRALDSYGDYAYDAYGDNLVPAQLLYRRAIEASQHVEPRDDATLLSVYIGLALAYQYGGDLQHADEVYQKATRLALETYGQQHERYWRIVADHAYLVGLRGDRARSQTMYAHLQALIPPSRELSGATAEVLLDHGMNLVAEGQPAEAVPILHQVMEFYDSRPTEPYSKASALWKLGAAYDQLGDVPHARHYLKAAYDAYVAGVGDPDGAAYARTAWAGFLFEQGDVDGAEREYRTVLQDTRARAIDATVVAECGMVRVALAHKDPAAAQSAAAAAQDVLAHVNGMLDVRLKPMVWEAKARALLAAGDASAARDWASRAYEADKRYDGDDSVYTLEAGKTLREVDAALK